MLTPTSGRVRLGGFDVARQRSATMARFGAVLEGSRNVYWSLSARQNLLYFGWLKGPAQGPGRRPGYGSADRAGAVEAAP